MHGVSINDTALACYNFNVHQPTSIIVGRQQRVSTNPTKRISKRFPDNFHETF